MPRARSSSRFAVRSLIGAGLGTRLAIVFALLLPLWIAVFFVAGGGGG